MFKILAELLMSKEVEFERGEIRVLKQRYCIVPTELMVVITEEFLKSPDGGKSLYKLSKEIMKKNYAEVVKIKYGLTKKKLIDWSIQVGEIVGYGTLELLDYDEKNMRGIAHVHNSPIGTRIKSQKPVDHMLRGMFAGIAEAAYGAEGDCIETKCIAKGDDYCEFIIRLRSDLEKEHNQIIDEQLPAKTDKVT